MRRAQVVLMATLLLLPALARADDAPATPIASDIGAAEVEAARQRAEARHAAMEKRAQEDIAAAKATQRTDREHRLTAEQDAIRTERRDRRTTGWVLAGTGTGVLALGGFFAFLSRRVNSDIRNGGYTFSSDIESRAVDGKLYNAYAWTFAGAGALALAIGVPILLTTHVDDVSIQIAPTVAPNAAGLTVSGALP